MANHRWKELCSPLRMQCRDRFCTVFPVREYIKAWFPVYFQGRIGSGIEWGRRKALRAASVLLQSAKILGIGETLHKRLSWVQTYQQICRKHCFIWKVLNFLTWSYFNLSEHGHLFIMVIYLLSDVAFIPLTMLSAYNRSYYKRTHDLQGTFKMTKCRIALKKL